MKESLFQEFEEVSAQRWKQKIQYDLKGEDYNEKLVYKSLEGINIKPFYHADDIDNVIPTPSALKWKICERIYVASAEISNRNAKQALQKGAESLWLIIPNEETEVAVVLKDIVLNFPLYIHLEFLSSEYVQKLKHFFRERTA